MGWSTSRRNCLNTRVNKHKPINLYSNISKGRRKSWNGLLAHILILIVALACVAKPVSGVSVATGSSTAQKLNRRQSETPVKEPNRNLTKGLSSNPNAEVYFLMYGPRELYEQTSLTTWDTIVPQLSTKLNVLSVRIRGANTLLLVRMTDDALTTIYNLTKPQMMKMSIIKYSLLHFTSLALDDADRKIMTGMDSASDSNTNPSSSSTDYLAIASLVLWLVCMLLLCPLLAYTVYRCYKARQSSATSEEDRLKKEMDTMTQKFAIARGASTLSGMSVPSRVGSIRESFMGGSTSTYSMGTSNSSLQGDPSRPAERTLSVNSALSQQDIARMRLEQQIIVKEAKAKKPLLRIPLQGSSTTLDLGSSSSMGSPSFNGLSAGESLDSSSVNSKSMTSSGYSRSLSTGSLRGKEPEIANDGSASRSVSLSKKMSVKNPLHRVIIEPF